MNRQAAVEAQGVVKTFEDGRIHALNGLDLRVEKGEFVALVGPSGCGKSTLLHLLAALEPPDAGRILVAGHDLASEHDLPHYRARHVGIIFQLHNLLPNLTAAENVQVPMFELGVSGRERRERASLLLALVGMEGHGTQRPAEFSGGERGWIGDSPFIFLDCRKIRELGWKPKLTIHEGILRTLEYLKANPWVLEARG